MTEYNSEEKNIELLANGLREQIEENRALKAGCLELTDSYIILSKILHELVRLYLYKLPLEDFDLQVKTLLEELKQPLLFFRPAAVGKQRFPFLKKLKPLILLSLNEFKGHFIYLDKSVYVQRQLRTCRGLTRVCTFLFLLIAETRMDTDLFYF